MVGTIRPCHIWVVGPSGPRIFQMFGSTWSRGQSVTLCERCESGEDEPDEEAAQDERAARDQYGENEENEDCAIARCAPR